MTINWPAWQSQFLTAPEVRGECSRTNGLECSAAQCFAGCPSLEEHGAQLQSVLQLVSGGEALIGEHYSQPSPAPRAPRPPCTAALAHTGGNTCALTQSFIKPASLQSQKNNVYMQKKPTFLHNFVCFCVYFPTYKFVGVNLYLYIFVTLCTYEFL